MPFAISILIAFALLGLGAVLYFTLIAPYRVEFVTHPMPVRHLPEALNGAKLIHISDIHTGYRVPNRYLIRTFERIKAYSPEYVVYTGDYITQERTTELHNLHSALQHAPHGRLGTAAILGNHDYGYQSRHSEVAEIVIEHLSSVDIPVLRNQSIDLNGLTIIGLDDYRSPNFNPGPILDSVDHTKANIVLTHNPDTVDVPVWNGYCGWILAGHTHGGQVSLPGIGPLLLPLKNWAYGAGEVNLKDGRRLYVNRGIGHLTKIRINVRPEVTIHVLKTQN